MDVADVVAAKFEAHLPDRLEERQRLDVADGPAYFDDRHFGFAGAALDERLDLVGDVRNHLHRPAEVIATALLADHALIHLAGGEIVPAPHARGLEALVMTEVEVGFRTIFSHENFSVLEGAHGARIHVDVRIELDVGDFDATRFEDRGERGGGYPLAKG